MVRIDDSRFIKYNKYENKLGDIMTPNKEDYLKCIYEIVTQHEKVTNKLVAQMMNVSAPAVTEMLRKLLQDMLIVKNLKNGYVLTELGMLQVSKLVRKHRLLEVFLMEKLNYSIEEVHAEAEILEHSVSDLFISRLDVLLNYPENCPHGGVIPKENELLKEETLPLTKALLDKQYVVCRLSQKQEVFNYMNEQGIKILQVVEILEKDKIAQLIKIKMNDEIKILSDVIASQIFVKIKE